MHTTFDSAGRWSGWLCSRIRKWTVQGAHKRRACVFRIDTHFACAGLSQVFLNCARVRNIHTFTDIRNTTHTHTHKSGELRTQMANNECALCACVCVCVCYVVVKHRDSNSFQVPGVAAFVLHINMCCAYASWQRAFHKHLCIYMYTFLHPYILYIHMYILLSQVSNGTNCTYLPCVNFEVAYFLNNFFDNIDFWQKAVFRHRFDRISPKKKKLSLQRKKSYDKD